MLLQIKSFITLIYEVFHLKKLFPLLVCVLCGCFLLRPTQWLNQYKVPSRQWKTTRKCSIIKLNYRQALKETNKYFVTIKLHFFIVTMIENVYKHAWHSGGRGRRLWEMLLLNGSKLLLPIEKWLGAENQSSPSGVSGEPVRQSQLTVLSWQAAPAWGQGRRRHSNTEQGMQFSFGVKMSE